MRNGFVVLGTIAAVVTLYFLAYFTMLRGQLAVLDLRPHPVTPAYWVKGEYVKTFFGPAHSVDRLVRRDYSADR